MTVIRVSRIDAAREFEKVVRVAYLQAASQSLGTASHT
jgi:hypothetical protein